jgi:hydroxyacylglutathione hydrolase
VLPAMSATGSSRRRKPLSWVKAELTVSPHSPEDRPEATGNAVMTMRIEQILADGVAQLSYLVGDDSTGTAAVVDPRPDVDVYLELAHRHGLSITHVLETHIHADFMSGAREIQARLGNAALCVSVEGGAEYDFPHRPLRDGDSLAFGSVVLSARFTPGHTPEHLSFLLNEADRPEQPFAVLTGDSLFVDSAGRPDLLGDEMSEKLVEQLFDTLQNFYAKLDDGVIVYPCHGAGSACGPAIGDRTSSSIGYERRFNRFLRMTDFREFRTAMLENAPPVPTHYPHLKKVNAAGPPILGNRPIVPAMTSEVFRRAVEAGDARLVDTRDMLAFGGGHIAGALNIGMRPELTVWAGWLLDPEKPILLVLEDDSDLEAVTAMLWRTGYVRFNGYLIGGMAKWQNAGLPMVTLRQMTVHEVHERSDELQVVDVRAPGEWAAGHVPGAIHAFVPDLLERARDLDRSLPTAVYCDSGFRASIGASMLRANGFTDVRNIPGSWQAWTAAGYPVEKD